MKSILEKIKNINFKKNISETKNLSKKDIFKLTNKDEFTKIHKKYLNKLNKIILEKNEIKTIEISEYPKNNEFIHYLIKCKENSELTIILKLTSKESKEIFYRSAIYEIYQDKNSKINFIEYQNLSNNFINYNYKKSVLDHDAKINFYDFHIGSKYTNNIVLSDLNGKGSESRNYSLYSSKDNQIFEIKNESNHYNEKTFSDMINKSTVNNSSNTKYIGTVNITRNAKFSNGYQQSHSMILDDESKSESIPILEIDNSEVKCSHGATVGKIDKEKVFYLMSRGFNKKESKKILVEGFITDLLKKIKNSNLRTEIQKEVMKKI